MAVWCRDKYTAFNSIEDVCAVNEAKRKRFFRLLYLGGE